MSPATFHTYTDLLMQVIVPAARALALGGLAGLGLTAFRVKATSARLLTWTAVLYCSLAMPLLGRLLPPLQIPTPAFLQRGSSQHVFNGTAASQALPASPDRGATEEAAVTLRVVDEVTNQPDNPASSSPSLNQSTRHDSVPAATFGKSGSPSGSPLQFSLDWSAIAAGIYYAVAALLLVRFVVGLILSHRLLRASQRIHDPHVVQRLVSCAQDFGLAFIPEAAESRFISVPVTMGAWRSTIVLPTAWREWGEEKLDAVIVHEMSHIARRDALTQSLSLLHRAIFWFSPLAWWLNRHLAELAEQASDEAALSHGADRNDYARTLLGFFEVLQTTPGRVWWQGVSMASFGQAERRVERILAWKGTVTMNLKKSIATLVVVSAMGIVYLAASVQPANGSSQIPGVKAMLSDASKFATQTEQISPAQKTGEPEPAVQRSTDQKPAVAAASAFAADSARVRATLPMPAIAAMDRQSQTSTSTTSTSSTSSSGHRFSYHNGYDGEQRFVIVSGKSDSVTMSGSSDDGDVAEELKAKISGDFILFRRRGKYYVIRDQATIDRAKKFWAPQEELGKKQEELGKQQEALGKQQEEIGAKMEQVQVKIPDMTEAIDRLKAKLQKLGSSATMEQIGDLQSEIGDLQSKIGEIQSQAGDQQGKIGEQMGALGEKQGKLGEQQGELGRQQAELAEQANRQMKQLLDEALAKGTAQSAPEI